MELSDMRPIENAAQEAVSLLTTMLSSDLFVKELKKHLSFKKFADSESSDQPTWKCQSLIPMDDFGAAIIQLELNSQDYLRLRISLTLE